MRSQRLAERIRGRRAVVLRQRIIREEPLCRECLKLGKVRATDEIDHIVPLHQGGTNERSNLQGLCRDHHIDKTARDSGREPRRAIAVDGWPVEG